MPYPIIHFALGAIAGSIATYLYKDKPSREKIKTTAKNASDAVKSTAKKTKDKVKSYANRNKAEATLKEETAPA